MKQFIESLEPRQLLTSAVLSALPNTQTVMSSGLIAQAVRPTVIASRPAANETNWAREKGIVLDISLPNGGVDENTLNSYGARLIETVSGNVVQCNKPQTSGGGDTIVLQPKAPLKATLQYTFQLNRSGLSNGQLIKDISGQAFVPYSFSFTTGAQVTVGNPSINFSQTDLNTVSGVESHPYSAITFGPDNRLYVATLEGLIYRYDVNDDGTLANRFTIDDIQTNNVTTANPTGKRFITGITFDPNHSSSNPVLWVSHGQYAFGNSVSDYATDGTGKVSRLYGTDLQNYQDIIVGIPRSVKDHLNNQITFDPIKQNLYFTIPSMTAMGAPDSTWGNRSENIYSAAIMRLNLAKTETWLGQNGVIDLTNYNPYKGSNPLRFYATGVRNAFDLLFHSNGKLYAPANGSAAGGNVPTTPTDLSTVPNSKRLDYTGSNPYAGPIFNGTTVKDNITENDYLFNITEGGYYGHPNPARGEYILNGGNPTSGVDPVEVPNIYPVGTLPDRNWRQPAYIFGKNYSPDGLIEYKSTTSAFGAQLKGYMLICRYSNGDDIIAIKPNKDGSITNDSSHIISGINGLTGLDNPLDLTEDPRNGNVYVVELTDSQDLMGRITLLKPKAVDAQASLAASRVSFYDTPGDKVGVTKPVVVTNSGTTPLVIDVSNVVFTGQDRKNFRVENFPTSDVTLLPTESYTFNVTYFATDTLAKRCNLAIATNDPDGVYSSVVQLRGFPAAPIGIAIQAPTTTASTSSTPQQSLSASVLATVPAGTIQTRPTKFFFNAVRGATQVQTLTIRNIGRDRLVLLPNALKITGTDASKFQVLGFPTTGISMAVGKRIYLTVVFTAASNETLTVKDATLTITSNDAAKPNYTISLRGLPTTGVGGVNEPSLAKILELYRLPIVVGDSNPNDVYLDVPPVGTTDEVTMPQLVKAGDGPVIVKPLAVFGVASTPGVRVGYYSPGSIEQKQYLFKIPTAATQAASVYPYGTVTFDPGSSSFGLVGQFPGFNNTDGSVREVYSEDSLNTWEPQVANRRKVRFYPLKNADGSVVANAYLVAFEEYTSVYDYQDVVLVVSNVKPAPTSPEIGLENVSGEPFADRLVFNKVQIPDANVTNVTKLTNTLRIHNTGTSNLVISSMSVTGNYSILSGGGTNIVLTPGSTRDVVVKFTATGGSISVGTLTIHSNDTNESVRTIQLEGFWQQWSEKNPSTGKSVEPTAQQIIDLMGYSTKFLNTGQTFKDNTQPTALGDEILSAYWRAADPSVPVRVVQLAAFHQQSDTTTKAAITSRIQWYRKGTPADSDTLPYRLFTHQAGDAQSILPRKQGDTANVASGFFKSTDTFGFKVDKAMYSDDSLNTDSPVGGKHFLRFYPAYDREGKAIPNTYLMTMDYNSQFINYDFNDNVYIISNMTPELLPNTPDTVVIEDTTTGPLLTWTPPSSGPTVAGFNVYRSISALTGYTKLNSTVIASALVETYTDTTAPAGTTLWYRITSVDANGLESVPVSIKIARA